MKTSLEFRLKTAEETVTKLERLVKFSHLKNKEKDF